MPRIRNKWGEDRDVPGYGRIEKDAVFEVPEEAVEGFVCQPNWEAEDHETQEVAEKAARARKRAQKAAASEKDGEV